MSNKEHQHAYENATRSHSPAPHAPLVDVAKLCRALGEIRLAIRRRPHSHGIVSSSEPREPLGCLLPLLRRREIVVDLHAALLLRAVPLTGKSSHLLEEERAS